MTKIAFNVLIILFLVLPLQLNSDTKDDIFMTRHLHRIYDYFDSRTVLTVARQSL